MKPIVLLLVLAMLATIAGCFVRTNARPVGRSGRACPPAHHWDGYGCVHNGNARGHGKHRGRD